MGGRYYLDKWQLNLESEIHILVCKWKNSYMTLDARKGVRYNENERS